MEFSPDRFRTAREQCGLTRAALANQLGISHESVKHYESGHRQPRTEILGKAADILHCPVGEFFHDPYAGWAQEVVSAMPAMNPGQVAAVARVFSGIDRRSPAT